MQLSGSSKWLLRLGTTVTLLFLYVPLIVIALYAFNSTRVQKWPPAGLTFDWFSKAFDNPGVRELGVASYAGVPLLTMDRQTIGAFCVFDVTGPSAEGDLPATGSVAAMITAASAKSSVKPRTSMWPG